MKDGARVLVAGADTLIGAALFGELSASGRYAVGGAGIDHAVWLDQALTVATLEQFAPDNVFVVAGHSGGIALNLRSPATLMRDNLLVATNLLHAAHTVGVGKLQFIASSCCYPRLCPQPMREESLLTGPVEPTSAAYATAKLAAIELCHAYRREHGARFTSVIPGDAYGPGDDFDPETSHVVAALIGRMHDARVRGAESVTVWGTGEPRRDFIYVKDLARALIYLMVHYDEGGPINVGTGSATSIRRLAEAVRAATAFCGELRFDASKPDGMPLKALDSSRLRDLGFDRYTSLEDGLRATVEWYREHVAASTPR